MRNFRKNFKNEEVFKVLKGASYGSHKFRRAVEKAYMDDRFIKYIINNSVCFEQGSGRVAYVPLDIVEDIIGTELALSRRAA
ncbi:MAG: hypothetical protein ACI4ON_01185 [Clostridia bacterium]